MGEVNRPGWVPRAWLALLAVAGLAGALYAYLPILDNAFVCDDYGYLAASRAVIARPATLFDNGALLRIYNGVVWRPLSTLLYVVLYRLFELQPRPYYALMIALHLVNVGLVAWLLSRWLKDGTTAVLAAALFAVAYGPRNGVTWISNANESLVLTGELLLLELTRRYRGQGWWPAVAGALVVAGCLLKETIAPMLVVLPFFDAVSEQGPPRWGRTARRWAPAFGLFALYAVVRLTVRYEGGFYERGLGPHLLRSWPVLVAGGFGSTILPVFFRAVGAPELLPLVAWTTLAVVAWLALRGAPAVRVLAFWLLVQPLPYTILTGTTPDNLHSHYLYALTVPALSLVALGLATLYRRTATRPLLMVVPVLLSWLLVRWCWWGIQRTRLDEREHWQVATDTLRRDFAVFDAARLAPGTRLVLVMPPAQTPAGGAWWGWEGYPLESSTPVTIERVGERVDPATLSAPYALFVYDKETGPRLLARRDRP